jgi:hypothetical protein
MKLASLTFFLLLLLAHTTGDFERLAAQPLSMFRYDSQAWLGYALFAALLLVGVLYVRALVRSQREAEAAISALGVLVLLIVALTPSTEGFHVLLSLLLFALLFGYYGVLLYRTIAIWLFAHLAVPIALAFAIDFHSYGLWQKSFIVYFVFLAAVHHHALTRQRLDHKSSPVASGLSRSDQTFRRRKVYHLGLDNEWRKRDIQRISAGMRSSTGRG